MWWTRLPFVGPIVFLVKAGGFFVYFSYIIGGGNIVAMTEINRSAFNKTIVILNSSPYVNPILFIRPLRVFFSDFIAGKKQATTSSQYFGREDDFTQQCIWRKNNFVLFVTDFSTDKPRDISSRQISCISHNDFARKTISSIPKFVNAAWFDADVSALQNSSVFLLPLFSFSSNVPQIVGRPFQRPSEPCNRYRSQRRNYRPQVVKNIFDFNVHEWHQLIGGAVFVFGIFIYLTCLVVCRNETEKSDKK